MNPESDRPWWSWAPNFPKPAIIVLALAVDLIIGGTWFYGIFIRGEATFSSPSPVGDVIINANPMANVVTALALTPTQPGGDLYDPHQTAQSVRKGTGRGPGQS